jgi:hypothetical protein
MKNASFYALFSSALFFAGCSSSTGSTVGDAGGAHDSAPDRAVDHAAPDSGDGVLSIDPFTSVTASAQEHEPFIAVSPGGRVGVSFASFLSSGTGITVGYRVSNDRGVNWGPTTLFPLPSGTNTQANASIAAGDDGSLYMSWGAEEHTESGRSQQGVYVAVSRPGTTTFETPVLVTNPSVPVAVYDQPRVTVTHSGVVLVTYDETSADGITSWLQQARSVDGKSWSLSYAVGAGSYGSFRNFARFCRPAGEGRIYLLYLDTDVAIYSGDVALALRYSDDDGMTWSSPLEVTNEADELILDPTAAIGCVTQGSDVWVVYGLTPIGELGGTTGGGPAPSASIEHTMTEVRVAHSGDSGKTIDSRSSVLDTSVSHAMYPVLVGEGDGTLDLSYYAGNYDNDPNAFFARTRSTDGTSFSPLSPIHSKLTLETNRAVSAWIGDYVGGAYQGGDVFLVYTDNGSPTPHIAFLRTPAALSPAAPEPDAGVGPSDGGNPGICYTNTSFTPVTWAPPTAFGQGACTADQMSAYVACTTSGDCSSFRSDSSNASCLACLETPESATAHGPFVTADVDGGVSVVDINFGGCQAHYDGETGTGSCGQQADDFSDCWNAECETCSDYANPVEYGATFDCYYWASDVGVCSHYRETTSCADETNDGGIAAICGDLATFVGAWCGP